MNNNTTEKKWVSLPEFPIPARYDNAGAYLRALVQEKIGEMVKNSQSGVACRAQRLEEELDVLCQGLPENILIIKDCVDAARKAGHDKESEYALDHHLRPLHDHRRNNPRSSKGKDITGGLK